MNLDCPFGKNLELLGRSPTPLGLDGTLAAVGPTKKLQYEAISSSYPLLNLHSPHLPMLALPLAPCIVIVDNTQ
jgi:hypothetical protein